MAKDLHKEEFDEGTKIKLAIFQYYLREWLPVFLCKKEVFWNTINIFDFFAGPGEDIKGIKGTPLIITEELSSYMDIIVSKKLNVNLYFNEYSKSKKDRLTERLLPENEDLRSYSITIESHDFKDAFEKDYTNMCKSNAVNLLFLDQNGIKHISEDIFQKIIALKQTDFLFFISSSTVKRFSELSTISQYIKLNPKEIEKTPYHKIHKLVLEYYRTLIPTNKKYYLAPFSLKKNTGLYGLIFGSGHVLGMEKFLTTCWSIDPERGEANFDIDSDNIIPGQCDLFTGTAKAPKKVEIFERETKEKILKKELITDKDLYLHAITNGFLPKHARKIIDSLVMEKKIKKVWLNLSSKVCKEGAKITEILFY